MSIIPGPKWGRTLLWMENRRQVNCTHCFTACYFRPFKARSPVAQACLVLAKRPGMNLDLWSSYLQLAGARMCCYNCCYHAMNWTRIFLHARGAVSQLNHISLQPAYFIYCTMSLKNLTNCKVFCCSTTRLIECLLTEYLKWVFSIKQVKHNVLIVQYLPVLCFLFLICGCFGFVEHCTS